MEIKCKDLINFCKGKIEETIYNEAEDIYEEAMDQVDIRCYERIVECLEILMLLKKYAKKDEEKMKLLKNAYFEEVVCDGVTDEELEEYDTLIDWFVNDGEYEEKE